MPDLWGNFTEEELYQIAISEWRRGFEGYWEKWKGVPRLDGGDRWIEKLDSVDDLWNWWISGKAYEGDKPDCQLWLW